jgi:allophanate hydrolase subunit 1
VATAGPYVGVYPRATPGGWNLLGHTDITLFDASQENPALLTPGTKVRFRDA